MGIYGINAIDDRHNGPWLPFHAPAHTITWTNKLFDHMANLTPFVHLPFLINHSKLSRVSANAVMNTNAIIITTI